MAVETTGLPTGRAALHPLWPEARWNVSGLFAHGRLIYDLYHIVTRRFECPLRLESVHGAPAVPWNSGTASQVPVHLKALAATVRAFNDAGIGVFFTFSNHLLEKGDLDNRVCNQMLEVIDNDRGLNGVVLAGDLLFDYLRRERPRLKLTSSVVKVTMENGRGNVDYYQALAERFDSVTLHPDDGFEYDLLDQLDREKIEIVVNEDCVFHCKARHTHYEVLARCRKTGGDSGREAKQALAQQATRCLMPFQRLDGKNRSCNFTVEEMKRVYDTGFRRFKLQGRKDEANQFLYDVLRFMVEPELLAPTVLKSFLAGWAKEHAEAVLRGATKAGGPGPRR